LNIDGVGDETILWVYIYRKSKVKKQKKLQGNFLQNRKRFLTYLLMIKNQCCSLKNFFYLP